MIPVLQPPATDGAGTGDRVPGHIIPSDSEVGIHSEDCADRCGDAMQQFGNALNLNVHFRMLFLDGVYTETKHGRTRFQRTNGPEQQVLTELVHTISHRVVRFLEREGILERDKDDCMNAGGRAK